MLAGAELVMLAEALPQDREIVGVDLAEGMVVLAMQRLETARLRSDHHCPLMIYLLPHPRTGCYMLCICTLFECACMQCSTSICTCLPPACLSSAF